MSKFENTRIDDYAEPMINMQKLHNEAADLLSKKQYIEALAKMQELQQEADRVIMFCLITRK